MSDITGTLGYQPGELVQATIQAYNSKGWSEESEPNSSGAVAKGTPNAPSSLAATVLSTTSVSLTWNEITTSPDNGYSTVTSYNVLSNGGSGTSFTTIATSSTGSATLSGLSTGYTYAFKVSAVNVYGEGESSSSVSIKVATKPLQMNAPVIQYSSVDVALTFEFPESSGQQVTDFEISFSSDGTTYTEQTALCDGSDPTVIQETYCTFTMSQLLSFGFEAGDPVLAKARAYNSYGWGDLSEVSNSDVLVQVEPNAPTNLALTNVDATTLSLSWDELTSASELGYADLLFYTVYWDQGIGTYIEYQSDLTTTTLEIPSLTSGTTYAFKVSATNIQGEGDQSLPTRLKAMGEPAQMDAPSLSEVGTYVRITLTPPSSTNGDDVSSYRVSILDKTDDTYKEGPCSSSILMSDQICEIKMSVFTTTYSYEAGEYIKVKAEALNTIGWSPISDANADSVYAQTAPKAPISLSAVSLTVTSVRLSWDRITSDAQSGYQTVTDYQILSNGGSGSTFTVHKSTTGNAVSVDLTGLTSGLTYIFKVRGINKFGIGEESSQVSILVALAPGKMNAITMTEEELPGSNTKNVVMSWNLPQENGSPVSQYRILFYSVTNTGYLEMTSL